MQGEDTGQDGQLLWEDRDEFRRLMDSLSQEELRGMLERLNADITANPDDTTALSARGLVHREVGDDRRAEEDFGRVVDLSPVTPRPTTTGDLPVPNWGSTVWQFWTTTSPSSSTQVTRYRITTRGCP